MYTGVGYAAGSVLGYIINLLVSPLMGSWFDKFTANTVGETVEVLGEIDYSAFRNIDISSFLLFSGILAVITIVIALIPSYTASRVSPVEAIKNE
jgi:ABC-type antimicrobial peptide transport system permease subunit